MDNNQLIRNWHRRAGTEDYFSKYVFEYLAFICFLKRVKFIEENKDFLAIRRLKHDVDSRDTYLNKIKSTPELGEAWQQVIKELGIRPLGEVEDNGWQAEPIKYWKCSHGIVKDHVCEEQGKVQDLEDWENMVEFWHSIRNNLFHGSKNPQDDRDKLLVESGYITLSSLVDIFLETQGNK